jgi:hypothetical protein
MTRPTKAELHQLACAIDDLLSTEDRWTKGSNAFDKYGHSVLADSSTAVCWCLRGAILHVHLKYVHDDPWLDWDGALYNAVARAIGDTSYIERSIVHWNDDPERTFAEVKAMLARLKAETAKRAPHQRSEHHTSEVSTTPAK